MDKRARELVDRLGKAKDKAAALRAIQAFVYPCRHGYDDFPDKRFHANAALRDGGVLEVVHGLLAKNDVDPGLASQCADVVARLAGEVVHPANLGSRARAHELGITTQLVAHLTALRQRYDKANAKVDTWSVAYKQALSSLTMPLDPDNCEDAVRAGVVRVMLDEIRVKNNRGNLLTVFALYNVSQNERYHPVLVEADTLGVLEGVVRDSNHKPSTHLVAALAVALVRGGIEGDSTASELLEPRLGHIPKLLQSTLQRKTYLGLSFGLYGVVMATRMLLANHGFRRALLRKDEASPGLDLLELLVRAAKGEGCGDEDGPRGREAVRLEAIRALHQLVFHAGGKALLRSTKGLVECVTEIGNGAVEADGEPRHSAQAAKALLFSLTALPTMSSSMGSNLGDGPDSDEDVEVGSDADEPAPATAPADAPEPRAEGGASAVPDAPVKGAAEGAEPPTALLRKYSKAIKSKEYDDKYDVMMSYPWTHQALVLRIVARLRAAGLSVWLDTEQMHGEILDRMASAVESASVVVFVATASYQTSPNCRSEATYARQQRKSMIPVMADPGFSPSGWLGLLVADKLWVDFSTVASAPAEAEDQQLGEKADELVQQIKLHTSAAHAGEGSSEAQAKRVQLDVASKAMEVSKRPPSDASASPKPHTLEAVVVEMAAMRQEMRELRALVETMGTALRELQQRTPP